MPSLKSCCSGINMEQSERTVVLDFQYMGMTANEKLRRTSINLTGDRRIITTGIAANMLHEHVNVLTLEAENFRVHQAKVTAIAVATNSPDRTEFCQPFDELSRANVASMPYLIARFEIVEIFVIPI